MSFRSIIIINLGVLLPETNSSPLKIGLPNRKVVFQPSIFGSYVSFREGSPKHEHQQYCRLHNVFSCASVLIDRLFVEGPYDFNFNYRLPTRWAPFPHYTWSDFGAPTSDQHPHVCKSIQKRKPTVLLLMEEILHHLGCMKPL